ncbi:DNA cytosine methyltransferase [Brevundimonas sp. BAL450]|uniref:DNA cytosine methyltransferase n=1 Tax=Brevundimonas sp. BAL450 TaxID=1708162 RepID=UPI0018C94A05|nr:DNA cytosine methyltransferase [Brevundimonas sp. BAL450]MBG7615606.1 DNA cytosine methyltransferase [Brevundimonas sp. BAL450]
MYAGDSSAPSGYLPDLEIDRPDGTASVILPEIVAIDLFAGAGGFSAGAVGAGISIGGALEFNKHAAATYRANIQRPDGAAVEVIDEDIRTVSPATALTRWKLDPGGCDLIIGGPPCQGFSTHRIKDAGVGDPRNELLARYFEYVGEVRPRVFLVENVPGLTWSRHRDFLQGFLDLAEKADYAVQPPVVLNAADYGVPQSRKRVFILGIDRGRPLTLSWPPAPTHCAPTTPDALRNGRLPWRDCKDAFAPADKGDALDIHMKSGPALTSVFESTPANGGSRSQSNRVLPCHTAHSGHKDVYGRINPAKPAPTMTTACINPSKGRFVHPTENHGITARQAARIQTFPENYTFVGGLTAAGQQIGNAVPVDLAVVLLKPIAAAIQAAKARERASN